jgi:MtaA/CmuA family methyltransferase
MNGYQRIMAALRGETSDATPVMLHNFMMAAREAGITMARFRSDPREIARCFAESVERYGLDGIVVDIDTATLAGACGVPVDFPEDGPARCHGQRLRSLAAVRDLEPACIESYPGVQVWLEAVRLLKHQFGNEILIRGNCDQCPFSLAGLLRSLDEWLMDLADPENSELAHALLVYCAGVTMRFVHLMAGAGAHVVSNGDSPAGPDMCSPKMYREFALPYEKLVAACAHELGKPYILHICGKTDRILPDMVSTSADGLDLDYKTDVRLGRQLMAGKSAFIGNLDPSAVLACGSPDLVEAKTEELLAVFRGNPRFILNAGCAIPAATPGANIRAMIRASRRG